MNEKNLSPQAQIENFTKKLETPQITLLQIRGLYPELQKLLNDIRAEYEKEKKQPTKEEEEEASKAMNNFYRKAESKIFSFVDKWEAQEFTPNDREVEFLQSILTSIWQNKEDLRLRKEHEAYQKDDKFTKQTDKQEQAMELSNSYHDKLLFLISKHYKEQTSQNSPSSNQKKNPTVLPWTLAIIFGIMMVIAFGVAGYFYYKQRKIKQFKV